jgi:DNA-directed RNA polymerase specialized sigma24 family protein
MLSFRLQAFRAVQRASATSTWLMTIVNNAARMQLRRRRRDSWSLDQEQGEDGFTFSERLPDSKPSPEEVSCTTEARDRLVEGAKQPSPKLRKAFQLRDILVEHESALAEPERLTGVDLP